MAEWWTYDLSDFLMFSPRTYYRMIERHNASIWPGQIVTLGFGLVAIGLLRRPTPRQGRLISAIVAVLWSWVAWGFLWKRYAAINWAAIYFAWIFTIEVLLLLWIGVVQGGLSFRPGRDAAAITGIGLLILSLAVSPMLAPLLGRGWEHAEIFGVAPDPTVIATMGLLLLERGHPRWGLLAVPVLWCLVSGATLWAMGSPEAWVLLGAALLTVGASARARSSW
ncbi:MAG: MFS transporter permease [Gemmatimonadales bacterium]|nr:MFS transporter permease [Gemmatimonadales bacterium]MBA3556152.1 MFS transporter permease [Gemmatimonadales bacterium]